jgi:hypothetical protein
MTESVIIRIFSLILKNERDEETCIITPVLIIHKRKGGYIHKILHTWNTVEKYLTCHKSNNNRQRKTTQLKHMVVSYRLWWRKIVDPSIHL